MVLYHLYEISDCVSKWLYTLYSCWPVMVSVPQNVSSKPCEDSHRTEKTSLKQCCIVLNCLHFKQIAFLLVPA